MIDFKSFGFGTVKIHDPSLRNLREQLVKAVNSGSINGLHRGQRLFVVRAKNVCCATSKVRDARATSVIVIDGPTPVTSRRVPASLVLLPVPQRDDLQDKNAEEVLAGVVRQLIAPDRAKDPDGVDQTVWRSRRLSCASAGESEAASAESSMLEALIGGYVPESVSDPFWQVVFKICAGDKEKIDRLLNRLTRCQTVWFSPYTGEVISFHEAIQIYATVQENWQANDRPSHCYGAQYWNHPSIKATFSGRHGDVSFHETREESIAAAKSSNGKILSWAGRTDASFEMDCEKNEIDLVRIEDGFLRSVGLGAGLARGAMLAVDDLGIYYDPSRPSRLEVLLREYDLSSDERERGVDLIELIKTARVSKYNFGRSRSYDFPTERKIVLVPGQVADDAAIRKSRSSTIDCANTPNVNLDLLKLARQRNPDAFLVFKPHPDVETGLRKGKVTQEEALRYVDEFAVDANIIDLIEAVDEVETFSSLSGFEALLRDKRVVVHGAPFYAGWGLSDDLTVLESRQRNRSLDELVYLALVKYARTIDPVTLLPCTPEFLVTRLMQQRNDRRHLVTTAIKRHASWLGRKIGL
ncbi:hypothetical protein ABLO27_03860 [Roseibium sp. SCPC15]|uniref:capsular polysaccharide export protein, LipB/KpsS family n=1 Tax=Roseibium sp. SCP15 TaxID=3141376 RepID=UPI00333A54D3